MSKTGLKIFCWHTKRRLQYTISEFMVGFHEKTWWQIKSRSTASARLSAYAHWLQAHRQTLWTGNGSSLLFAALGKAEPLISTAACQKFDLDPWPWHRPLTLTLKRGNSDVKTRFLPFDLDLWPTTLTYNPSLAKINVDPHTKNQGQRSNGSSRRARTNWQNHKLTNKRTDATKYIISQLRGR